MAKTIASLRFSALWPMVKAQASPAVTHSACKSHAANRPASQLRVQVSGLANPLVAAANANPDAGHSTAGEIEPDNVFAIGNGFDPLMDNRDKVRIIKYLT